jgi:dihydroorotase
MNESTLIQNVTLVNEGKILVADVLIAEGLIQQIGKIDAKTNHNLIDGTGKHLFPGIIDGQVHFRDPGLTHKGDLYTESKAAIAGGVTSFIDMPNTVPNILTIESLKEKFDIASKKSLANYSFFLGVNGDNIDEVIKMDTSQFIGVSDDGLYFTKKGNLLADNPEIMEKLFANCKSIIAIHSEKEEIVEKNEQAFKEKYGDDIPAKFHPVIRSTEGCYDATKRAIDLAKNTRPDCIFCI